METEGDAQQESPETSLQRLRHRDPAQAIMEATKGFLVERSDAMLQRALNRTDLENVSLGI